jgi:hypothetical protein
LERLVLKWRIVVGAVAVGVFGLALSTILMENPYGEDRLFYGYPLLWLETSKSLWVQFPPIPRRVVILTGFFVDFPLYLIAGFVISYLVFTLNENMKLLKFFIKSGAVIFVGTFLLYGILASVSGPRIYGSPPFIDALQVAFLFSLAATPAATIIYGYCRLFKRWKTQRF